MPTIPAASAPRFALPGAQFTGLAAPSRGATETAAWIVEVAPHAPGAPHQVTREEVFVAIEGAAEFTIAGERHAVSAGGAVVVPALTDFSLANPHAQPFRAVVAFPVGGEALLPSGERFTPPWAA
ncbi:MAG: cupin domain-containing protein [Gemmatimonadetes bacterium]|nr:cupin domain-containing protein [Gemmatimonadota bacterium]